MMVCDSTNTVRKIKRVITVLASDGALIAPVPMRFASAMFLRIKGGMWKGKDSWRILAVRYNGIGDPVLSS